MTTNLLGVPQEKPSYTTVIYMQSSVSAWPYEPRVVDSVSFHAITFTPPSSSEKGGKRIISEFILSNSIETKRL